MDKIYRFIIFSERKDDYKDLLLEISYELPDAVITYNKTHLIRNNGIILWKKCVRMEILTSDHMKCLAIIRHETAVWRKKPSVYLCEAGGMEHCSMS